MFVKMAIFIVLGLFLPSCLSPHSIDTFYHHLDKVLVIAKGNFVRLMSMKEKVSGEYKHHV
jgi:hypothetical protein